VSVPIFAKKGAADLAKLKFLKRLMAYRDRFRPWVIKRTILATHPVKERGSKKLCFFASYDTTSQLSPFVRLYLEELQRCGFDIVFCTTSPELRPDTLVALSGLCHLVIHRENIGHDFASWKACFQLTPDWRDSESLLITNDSIFGPLYPLSGIFDKMDGSSTPCWGMNDSNERAYHLQSCFVYVKHVAFQSKRFARFWRSVSLLTEKYDIVKFYELGLSQALFRDGMQFEVLFPCEKIRKVCLSLGARYQYPKLLEAKTFNASLLCAYEMVSEMGYPFVKTDAIKSDRYASRHYSELCELLAQALPAEDRHYVEAYARKAS
jgi:hypothetical protein